MRGTSLLKALGLSDSGTVDLASRVGNEGLGAGVSPPPMGHDDAAG